MTTREEWQAGRNHRHLGWWIGLAAGLVLRPLVGHYVSHFTRRRA